MAKRNDIYEAWIRFSNTGNLEHYLTYRDMLGDQEE